MAEIDTRTLPRPGIGTYFIGSHWRLLLVEMMRVLLNLRWILIGFLSLAALGAALAPAFAWLSKTTVQRIELGEIDPFALLPEFLPIFLAIILGLVLADFGESILSKLMETRLIIVMQRSYLERHQQGNVSQDVAHMLFGSDVAKKGFQVIYKDIWTIITVTTSVLLWQLSLGAQWVPFLIFSMFPTIYFVWYFGHRISHTSLHILDTQSSIAETTVRRDQSSLYGHQERYYLAVLRLHILKWLAENASDLVLWASFGLLALLAMWFGLGPSLRDISLAELTALAINLKLLSKPLGNVGRVYTRWQEAYPALMRSLLPQMQQEKKLK
ncbi:MAG: hypothetical protein LRY63_09385 [Nitrincola sp.]|nr:hypothetical protein [Nitrincola sp.]